MPHLTYTYSANAHPMPPGRALFSSLHQHIGALGGFNVADIKSRAVMATDVFIGDGDAARAFVHLEIRILQGRELGLKQALLKTCAALVTKFLADQQSQGKPCQMSVELIEVSRASYFKGATP